MVRRYIPGWIGSNENSRSLISKVGRSDKFFFIKDRYFACIGYASAHSNVSDFCCHFSCSVMMCCHWNTARSDGFQRQCEYLRYLRTPLWASIPKGWGIFFFVRFRFAIFLLRLPLVRLIFWLDHTKFVRGSFIPKGWGMFSLFGYALVSLYLGSFSPCLEKEVGCLQTAKHSPHQNMRERQLFNFRFCLAQAQFVRRRGDDLCGVPTHGWGGLCWQPRQQGCGEH